MDQPILHQGPIFRRVFGFLCWKKQWCVLQGQKLLFFRSQEDVVAGKSPHKTFDLRRMTATPSERIKRFKLLNGHGKCCRIRVHKNQLDKQMEWAHALSSAVLFGEVRGNR